MNRSDVSDRLKNVFEDFFNKSFDNFEDVTMENFEEWDSITHLNLVLEIEGEFDITFNSEEILKLNETKLLIDKILEII